MSTWVVYSRDACSLCQAFIDDLVAVLGPEANKVQLVDVATDPQLEARFGTKIPLLTVDGDIVCMYRLDADRIRAHLPLA